MTSMGGRLSIWMPGLWIRYGAHKVKGADSFCKDRSVNMLRPSTWMNIVAWLTNVTDNPICILACGTCWGRISIWLGQDLALVIMNCQPSFRKSSNVFLRGLRKRKHLSSEIGSSGTLVTGRGNRANKNRSEEQNKWEGFFSLHSLFYDPCRKGFDNLT